jgi:hypothetical protein
MSKNPNPSRENLRPITRDACLDKNPIYRKAMENVNALNFSKWNMFIKGNNLLLEIYF